MSVSVLVARNELVSLILPLPGMQRAVVIELKSRIVRVLNVTDPSAVKTGKEHAARVTHMELWSQVSSPMECQS